MAQQLFLEPMLQLMLWSRAGTGFRRSFVPIEAPLPKQEQCIHGGFFNPAVQIVQLTSRGTGYYGLSQIVSMVIGHIAFGVILVGRVDYALASPCYYVQKTILCMEKG